MKVRFLLNEELTKGLKEGNIKTVDLIKFLLDQEGVTTLKDNINECCLLDIFVNRYKVIAGSIDNWTYEIELELSEEYTLVENIEEVSACMINNYKENRGYTSFISRKDNTVYLSVVKGVSYDNKGLLKRGVKISKNKGVNSLLTSEYCKEAIDYLFSNEVIAEFEKIKKDFNFKMELSTDENYIKSIKGFIARDKQRKGIA